MKNMIHEKLFPAVLVTLLLAPVGCLTDGSGDDKDLEAPTITSQSSDTSVAAGATVTFSVTAAGTAPLSYLWVRNGTDTLFGDTASVLVLANVSAAANGTNYLCLVRNAAGVVASNPVSLAVTAPPVISVHPADQTVNAGQLATFTVVASGSGTLTYQWMRDGDEIVGATAATYTRTAVSSDDGVEFKCRVTDEAGSTTSGGAFLRIRVTEQTVLLGAQNGVIASSLDLDNWVSYTASSAPAQSSAIDIVFAYSTSGNAAALYSPHVAKNGVDGSAGFDFMQTWTTANNTDIRVVEVADWNTVTTAAAIKALYDAGTTPTPAGRVFVLVGTTIVARSNLDLYVLLRVDAVVQGENGTINITGKAKR